MKEDSASRPDLSLSVHDLTMRLEEAEETLRAHGVRLEVLQDEECIALMRDFIRDQPALWNEDIGV